jgi:hypothetical protein
MSMNKLIISNKEVAEIGDTSEPQSKPGALPPAIPVWVKTALAILVLVLPLLCLIAAVLRISFRNQPPRTKHAWAAYLSSLLIISGLITSGAIVGVLCSVPAPAIGNAGLSELDERTDFPKLPSTDTLNGTTVSQELKSLVVVVSPPVRLWFGRQDVPSSAYGAGALLQADAKGYVVVTARHVVGEIDRPARPLHALVAGVSGIWGTADIVGVNRQRDLALLWIPRHFGHAEFVQPISPPKDGEAIFVIGHPQGLRFSLSTGIVSRQQGPIVQVSAPVSPGNSGGPVYDDHGNLVAIVSSTMDKNLNPNAENLNFAVSADGLLNESGWEFVSTGRQHFKSIQKANVAARQ